ncbi:CoA-binding protein [Paenibacillus massiliensis]|uniref:CoA-binding protein n=1 Tax=Paenibacillus massiliensis TaxID=225917 RepID=UPI00042A5C92|nr:CoA-binding protein [Paenibacillus massiliensis]
MTYANPDRDTIRQILEQVGNIAVVGLSDKTDRTSYMVAAAMQSRGYRIIPVNPTAAGQTILGETCYASLKEVPEPIDMVNVFRRSEFCADVAREAVEVKASTLWLQQGIISEEAAEIATSHGMQVIMDRCIKVEEAITRPNRP